MNSSYDNGSSSTPSPQRPHNYGHHHHHSTHKSPPHSTSIPYPDDSPVSGAGRQRVRTEPSPRHQHTSSGWLGPYNEQPSPLQSPRSPRGPRLAGSHRSSAAPEYGGVVGGGSSGTEPGSDRIIESHKALGSWQLEGPSVSNISSNSGSSGSFHGNSTAAAGGPGLPFKRREFEPKFIDAGMPGPLIESTSVQSLVESIGDDHVFKLTEMTKKRVEHNNPAAQKKQRVVSLPSPEASMINNFQPSEKTLQLSSSCKANLESRYTQLFQSINAGHPINRLEKLREVLPRIKATSMTKSAHDGKGSIDLSQGRSRRIRSEKYQFVDKVEESSCIWDLDHMETKAAAEAAVLAKYLTIASSTNDPQQQSKQTVSSIPQESSVQHAPSASTESSGVDNSLSGESFAQPTAVNNNSQSHDLPQTTVVIQGAPLCISPSNTFPPVTNPSQASDSVSSAITSSDPDSTGQTKDGPGESKLRFADAYTPAHQTLPVSTAQRHSGLNNNGQAFLSVETSPSKRNSLLGIFGVRGKKMGQDNEHLYHLHESPRLPSDFGSPRLTATAPTYERRSFEGPHNPYSQASQPAVEAVPFWLTSSPVCSSQNDTEPDIQGKRGTPLDTGTRAAEEGVFGPAVVDGDGGGHWAPPVQWPQGERMDESQDESDNAAVAMNKRSSLRRFTDKVIWKRGHKALSAIQQNESSHNSPMSPVHGKPPFAESGKSLGKKVDPAIAYLHRHNSGRLSVSQPSSGRNSLEGSSRPKLNYKAFSSSNSPVLEAVKNPDSIETGLPKSGSINGMPEASVRMDRPSPMVNPSRSEKSSTSLASRVEKSPMLDPSRSDKSPLLIPASSTGEDISGNLVPYSTDPLKQPTFKVSQLIVEIDRIPKRMLQQLKQRPELDTVDWTSDNVDLSALWTSSDTIPTYDEFVGISSEMKASHAYPSFLEGFDVLDIHLTLDAEEPEDIVGKNRTRKWDLLELRVDQELNHGEKWLKEVTAWSSRKADAIERHQRDENPSVGEWHLDENEPLVEEPEEEEGLDDSAALSEGTDYKSLDGDQSSGNDTASKAVPVAGSSGPFKSRKQQRDLSLISRRDLNGSISSFHNSMNYTFKTSVESTRESIKEVGVYLHDCRERLQQLHEATGMQLRDKEPLFKEVVDRFTLEWNESYFVKLKEVEDQIQVMNLKRIENPWMDMLLIMLSWVIRGLFYLVEGVTIMIIIVRHAWSKAKKGFEVIRNTRREQERISHRDENIPSGTRHKVMGDKSAAVMKCGPVSH
ncbi:hypothetical protein BG011_005059 [Mortierella polycephala]|uniref:Uncharacterized protein n=1 Tax=Mortierella polycephala TaxID=41804 RepID=A0A9P6PYT3_9FUNG|nr:hypothetical protein BG011_005059 [Mortierella polycephala]